MSALFFLFIAAVWLVIVIFVILFVTRRITKTAWQLSVGLVLFLTLLPFPLIDEIIGAMQFKKLCEENTLTPTNWKIIAGKTVYYKSQPTIYFQRTMVPIRMDQWRFLDVTNNEPIVSYNTLQAKGGILSMGGPPWIFQSFCGPKERPSSIETFKDLGITYIESPITQTGKVK